MRRILATLAALPAVLIAATPAQAFTPKPLKVYGHSGTVIQRGRWQRDTLTLRGPAGNTTMEVLCTGGGGNQWDAYGNFSQEFNQEIANWWCGNI